MMVFARWKPPRLPANVCMVLAVAGDIPLHDLAALADKVLEVASPTVSNIQAPLQAQQATTSSRQRTVLRRRPRKRTAAVGVKPGTAHSGGGELGG
ncbi:hypothetical protein HPB47_016940 [Ixodes persulcatus]|uniref:Uncharacterized protein n=1 Tax=Ixodes persulcatus TaxID=34615 RepID=A0AC60QS16_IXOPE|nr:hypothetical protein HPB47_016940 [Ixodes persulcatus]